MTLVAALIGGSFLVSGVLLALLSLSRIGAPVRALGAEEGIAGATLGAGFVLLGLILAL